MLGKMLIDLFKCLVYDVSNLLGISLCERLKEEGGESKAETVGKEERQRKI